MYRDIILDIEEDQYIVDWVTPNERKQNKTFDIKIATETATGG